VLHLCAATVTSRGVEIRPPVPSISKIPSFTNARRRVYLTATLADDSILVTDLDANPELLSRTVTSGSAADLGDRMILAPIALNSSLDPEAIRMLPGSGARGQRDGLVAFGGRRRSGCIATTVPGRGPCLPGTSRLARRQTARVDAQHSAARCGDATFVRKEPQHRKPSRPAGFA
jgi:hypothetical protein